MNYQLLLGDCLQVMKTLPANSVHMVCTSPPYYGLRSYLHNEHDDKHLEIGTEQTPDAYVAALVEVFREVRRVLRGDGTLWLNLGDSYVSNSKGSGGPSEKQSRNAGSRYETRKFSDDVPEKNLLGMPWRVAFALQADGWILRSEIIWHKRAPMPESVTDRPTKAHEQVFLLAKSATYYYDHIAIMEEGSGRAAQNRTYKYDGLPGHETKHGFLAVADVEWHTRNKRSVWTLGPEQFAGSHFATMPTKLVEPCILAGTSAYGCCAKCGAPWSRVVERGPGMPRDREVSEGLPATMNGHGSRQLSGDKHRKWKAEHPDVDRGWRATCLCGCDDIVPCVVLDPFSGAATTGIVALKHHRRYIGIELNPDYIRLSEDRLGRVQPMLLDVTT